MKFSLSSAELKAQLQMISGAIGSNQMLPILEDFLFRIEGEQLTITATDLETTISTTIAVQADKNGLVAIPAKILLDTLKALPEQMITLNVDEESFGVQITSAYGKYKLSGEDGNDYPRLPEPEDASVLEVPAKVLAKGIQKTLFATSSDDLRPAMTGVFFNTSHEGLTFVATDAHKLVRYLFKGVGENAGASFILPKKALNLLKNVLPAGDDLIKVSFTKANAFFTYDNISLICRLIDARFPDYNAVIPNNNPNKLNISKQDLQNSLKRIAIYANKTTNQVVLNIGEEKLNISAQDLDFSNEADENLPCHYDGDDLKIGFNAKFLIEMLNVLDGDEVSLTLSTPSRPGILTPSVSNENEDLLMLVMPVILHS